MKYGAIPENLLERFALWTGKVPLPLIDSVFGLMKARVLMAGVSLGIFEAMREGKHTAADVARRLSLDEDCVHLLLRTLVYAEYMEQSGNEFQLSDMGRSTLLSGAPMEMCGYLMWNYTQWKFMEHLEDLIRTGKGLDFHNVMTDPNAWAQYQRGMMEIAKLDAPEISGKIPVREGATRMLDLGGSHGLFSAVLCRKHPPLRSTVIDLPEAIESARNLAIAAKSDDVVEHRAGDVLTCELDPEVDVILMSNILHHFGPDQVLTLLKRAHAALQNGGTLAIWEMERPSEKERASEGDGAALFFRLTSTASTYAGADYAGWAKEAGFQNVTVTHPARSPGNVLVTARKSN